MSKLKTFLDQEYIESINALEYFRSRGWHRLESESLPWKEPYHPCANEIFWFEWRIRRIKVILDALFIVEDKGIKCPFTLKALNFPVENIDEKDDWGNFIDDDQLDALASIAMLIN